MPPAPDLTPQTPGEPLTTVSPLASAITGAAASTGNPNANETSTAKAQAPLYVPKHRSGGVFYVKGPDGLRVGDFLGTKEQALAEASRLTAGGEPYVHADDADDDEPEPFQAQPVAVNRAAVDATSLRQAVMTVDGWLCPEVAVKE